MAMMRPVKGYFAAIDGGGMIITHTIMFRKRDAERLAGDWAYGTGAVGWARLKSQGYRIGKVDVGPHVAPPPLARPPR